MQQGYVIGIDVGTSSARAGVFDPLGNLRASAAREIKIWHGAGGIVEQSSEDIWNAVCGAARAALAAAEIDPDHVVGIGFDATCSLVVIGADGAGLPVGPSGDHTRDVIVWMDHRASAQAARINSQSHEVLQYVGGRISPEMQTPKLLCLAENLPQTFENAEAFFDLVDFLTWKATGSLARSSCTVTCKWTYLAHERRWVSDYFHAIGLGVLADEGFRRIGAEIVAPGHALAQGLSASAAKDLGLRPGVMVGAGLIDAHAGGIATAGITNAPHETLAYVFGTSSCTMCSSDRPLHVSGVWGPYFNAMVAGLWLNEGGQSAAGAAIERLIHLHPAFAQAQEAAAALGQSVPAYLAQKAAGSGASNAIIHARKLHVVPEFLGNRAPFADPDARAVIAGLGMEQDLDNLVALYVAGVASLGYGLRQIVEVQRQYGLNTRHIAVSGGAGQSDFVRQIVADATGIQVVASQSPEPVLLGAAMLGAMAAGLYPDMGAAMRHMTAAGQVYTPVSGALSQQHDQRYASFLALQLVARSLAG